MARVSASVVVLSCALAGCAAEPEDRVDVIVEDPPAYEPIAAPTPEQIEATNRRPCGGATIAVITTDDNDQYVFCTGVDGVAVLESLWNPSHAQSRLEANPLPDDLVDAVLPAGDPTALLIHAALATGVAPAQPFLIGTRDLRAPQFASSCNIDTFYDTECSVARGSYWDQFADVFVDPPGTDRAMDCSVYSLFCHQAWGHHIRWASLYQAGGLGETGSAPWMAACGAKEWLVSCGGSTYFQGSIRGGTSGSWNLFTAWWVASGSSSVWVYYANGDHVCRGDTDRDDVKVDAVSEPGASHNASTMFMKKVTSLYGCDPE
jgi:hypothetical protein